MADESFFAEDIVPSHHSLSTCLLSNETVHRHDSLVKDDEGAGKLGGKIVWRRVRHRAPVPIIVVSLNLSGPIQFESVISESHIKIEDV